ncbi:uncharacterized protein LOC127800306 [Diospyros lotus]|uniref:uncharacterized protein LOC127800306 n=1 Tax=Diospyros lotus TaxID=55363 RepID=UPI00225507D4|nr:uncharacterized protein LOC127800306 [Diospyros lotus]
MEQVCNDGLPSQAKINANGGSTSRSSGTNGPQKVEPTPLKSNLKKTATVESDLTQPRTDTRKVSWPDAHGKDIAHVREFEASVPEEGELQGVHNSCVCTIQ